MASITSATLLRWWIPVASEQRAFQRIQIARVGQDDIVVQQQMCPHRLHHGLIAATGHHGQRHAAQKAGDGGGRGVEVPVGVEPDHDGVQPVALEPRQGPESRRSSHRPD
jgi:hypothetical protein